MEIPSKPMHLLNQLTKTNPSLVSVLKVGDLVEGKVLEKTKRLVILDLGKYGLGAIYPIELLNAGKDFIKNLKKNDSLTAKVIDLDNEDGFVELSIAQAGWQQAWQNLAELKEQEEIIKVTITGFNSGGLITKIKDIPAFLPLSQLSTLHFSVGMSADKNQIAQVLAGLVGKELTVKIIDLNPRTNKLIISEKEAVGENVSELIKNYQIGQVIEGIVSGLTDFGVFVRFADNPALEGLIHTSELSHRLIDNPKEIVKVDDLIKAKIIEIQDGKIFLSLKALEPDPWEKINDYYKEKQLVKGRLYRFYPFGAIVDLDHNLQGQVRVTDFGSLEEMKKQLALGKEYSFMIESLEPKEKRMVLKLAASNF